MEREELFKLVNRILNETSEADMEVIREAVRRREERSAPTKPGAFSPENTAKQLSRNISEQLDYSRDSIRSLVQGFAADVIRKNAPELTEEQIGELIGEWVPEPSAQRDRGELEGSLPADVLITMAQQFISFAQGKMPPSQQAKLNEEISDWHKAYWERFPSLVREAIALFLKEIISEDDCWKQIYAVAEETEDSGSQ
jgi:hypothetical protein